MFRTTHPFTSKQTLMSAVAIGRIIGIIPISHQTPAIRDGKAKIVGDGWSAIAVIKNGRITEVR